MITPEFSLEFDLLYNNIMSNAAPGLNEYEKSLFLTQAQESIVRDIYNGKYNGISFEGTEEASAYLNPLVKQVTMDCYVEGDGVSGNSVFFPIPPDMWFITYETALIKDECLKCCHQRNVVVRPVTQDTYYSISRNPFRRDNDRRVLRLLSDNKIELISRYPIKSYTVRYLSKPQPIILTDLTDSGLSIEGRTYVTECQLHPAIHRAILSRAVQLAKAAWAS